MSFSVPPAFAQAELQYRQQRIKAEYPVRATRPARRFRLAGLFKLRRRPNPAPRLPLGSPHHLTSGGYSGR